MNYCITPSALNGSVKIPSSKSMAQRAVAAALLAGGNSVIHNLSGCKDERSAIMMAACMGALIKPKLNQLTVVERHKYLAEEFPCGESGLALRLFAPLVALSGKSVKLTGTGSLLKRPVGMIKEALEQLGVRVETTDGYLPVTLSGTLTSGNATIDGSAGSQMLSGLLMALPLTSSDSLIRVTDLKSRPYVDMTLEILHDFGIKVENRDYREFFIPGNQVYTPREYIVEGDWSSAAFMLVAGAIRGNIEITGLNLQSKQADIAILQALDRARVKIDINGNGQSIHIAQQTPLAFEFDTTHCPDLFPPLAALAAYCEGSSIIHGISRLIHKESNRLVTVQAVLNELGIRTEVNNDSLMIQGGPILSGQVDSYDDHRIAMMAAVMALGAGGDVMVKEGQCVDKSYTHFFDDLASLGAGIKAEQTITRYL
jgi:3-phosphoshikimate 1-carboxyvinyltransferase